MRVISGRLGGRTFSSPGNDRTHPMSDKIRGALFNALGNIEGLRVLDAFAGSGAISYEAVSRGALYAIALDTDVSAVTTIRKNIEQLAIGDKISVYKANAVSWTEASSPRQLFDVVICDPPYNDVQLPLLRTISLSTIMGGILVVSLPPSSQPDFDADFDLLQEKAYGDARLYFYRRVAC